MAIRREILEGDTSHFAFKVSFQDDPDGGEGSGPEWSASWGAFEFWVNGLNLCAHHEDGQPVNGIHWYLLPLFEWLVKNWNPILHEGKFPIRTDRVSAWESLNSSAFAAQDVFSNPHQLKDRENKWQAWWRRHALASCREGGLYPDIVLRRESDKLEVSWGRTQIAGMPRDFRFLSDSGLELLDLKRVAVALHRVLEQAGDYLITCLPESPRLQRLRGQIALLSSGDRTERIAWIAGLGHSIDQMKNLWTRSRTHLEEKAGASLLETEDHDLVTVGSCQAAMMFGSLSPDIDFDDVLLLADKMLEFTQQDRAPDEFGGLARFEPLLPIPRPYEQGYELAQETLDELNGRGLLSSDDTWIDIEELLESLGILREDLQLSDKSIRGVAIASPNHRPAILVNPIHPANQSVSGRRYTMAHELCHLLFDQAIGNRLALASGPWAPRGIEQRANAFAAMLLMPFPLVDRAIAVSSHDVTTSAAILEIAEKLHVSRTSLLSHLKNLGRIDEEAEERIEHEFEAAISRSSES